MSKQRARAYRASSCDPQSRTNRSACALAAAALAGLVGSVHAADLEWIGPAASPAPYETAANWQVVGSPGVNQAPTTGDDARITNGGIASVGSAGGSAGFLLVGSHGGTGSLQQTDGTLTVTEDLHVGGNALVQDTSTNPPTVILTPTTGTGSYSLSGGALNTTFDIRVGGGGTGTFNMSGGTIAARSFGMAWGDNTSGTATQTGGSITLASTAAGQFWMSEGNVNATSSYTMDGATASISAGDIGIGTHGTATFTLNNGSVTSATHIRIGDNANYPSNSWRSTGTLNINGGTMSNDGGSGNHILLGHIGQGTINMTGGALTTDRLNMGQHGQNIYGGPASDPTTHSRGVINQSGGTITVDTAMVVGEQSLNDNQVNISGGNIILRNASTNNVTMFLGSSGGRGTLNLSGTGNVVIDAHIFAGSGSITSRGAVNISGGTAELGKNIRFTTAANLEADPRRNLLSGGFMVLGEFGQATANISGGDTTMDFLQLGRQNRNTSNPSTTPTNLTHASQGQATMTGGTVTVGRSVTVGGSSLNNNFLDISGGTLNLPGVVIEPETTPAPDPDFVGDWPAAWRNAVNKNELQPGLHVARNSGALNGGPTVYSNGRLTIDGTAAVTIAGGLYNSTGNFAGTVPGGVGLIEMKSGTLSAASFLNGSPANPGTPASANYNQTGGSATLGHVTGTGNVTVSGGTMNVKSLRQANATVSGSAVVKVAQEGTSVGTSNVGTLDIAGNGTLDLTNNKLVTTTPVGTFSGGAYSGVQKFVANAYNFGAWDKPGLTTSEDLADPTSGPLGGTTTIAVNKASEVLFIGDTDTGVFSGQTVTGATTLAVYTYAGDVNLDGLVDAADYGVIDNWVQFPGTDGYMNGDFNYDGIIDAADYGIIDNTFQLQGEPIPMTGAASGLAGVTAVPEPGALSLVAVAAAGLLHRRRSRRGR